MSHIFLDRESTIIDTRSSRLHEICGLVDAPQFVAPLLARLKRAPPEIAQETKAAVISDICAVLSPATVGLRLNRLVEQTHHILGL
jgi:hypothetical protein